MKTRFKSPKPYLQILVVLLLLMSLPRTRSENIQGVSIAILAPAFNQLTAIKRGIHHLTEETIEDSEGQHVYVNEEIDRLRLQNQLLQNEVAKLKGLLTQETFIQQELGSSPLGLIRKRERQLILELEILSIQAQVIYRSSSSWNNTLWINAGSAQNEKLDRIVVDKNSPVVVGSSIVGVIDYVGKNQSRVRLITDSSLTPSVRAIRHINDTVWYLAKGELHGCTDPKWRSQSNLLQGVGFNYDFSDDEGPARDLRTGEPEKMLEKYPSLAIVLPNDQLISTGMDGVFPPGLNIAKVTDVKILKEGDYGYELEAQPSCGTINNLSLVSVLPPLIPFVENRQIN